MPSFFIDRPIFAWVVAIFIMLAGVIAIPLLPVAQYPNVAPPQITDQHEPIPAPRPEDIYQSVTRQIEEELNGVDGLLYFESTSDTSGRITITATFAPGHRYRRRPRSTCRTPIRRVEPRLPQLRHPAGHPRRGGGHAAS